MHTCTNLCTYIYKHSYRLYSTFFPTHIMSSVLHSPGISDAFHLGGNKSRARAVGQHAQSHMALRAAAGIGDWVISFLLHCAPSPCLISFWSTMCFSFAS